MSNRDEYTPGPASGAEIKKEGGRWTLVLVRDLRHPPAKVWQALTDPAQLREWGPYDADKSLGTPGLVKLTTVGAPKPTVSDSQVKRADAPRLLEFSWGGMDVRWELAALGGGTRLTLWHNIDKNWISMGAAGWHVCLDVMDGLLADKPIGRTVGPDAMKVAGWQKLHAEYATLLGVEMPKWGAQ
jgi:uncharacterized protein YndB with AHSA1/START domain